MRRSLTCDAGGGANVLKGLCLWLATYAFVTVCAMRIVGIESPLPVWTALSVLVIVVPISWLIWRLVEFVSVQTPGVWSDVTTATAAVVLMACWHAVVAAPILVLVLFLVACTDLSHTQRIDRKSAALGLAGFILLLLGVYATNFLVLSAVG